MTLDPIHRDDSSASGGAAPLAGPAATPGAGWGDLLQKLGAGAGLALAFALFGCLEPRAFIRADNLIVILRQSAPLAIAALGMTAIIIAGGIDLSIGAQVALVAVVTARLLQCHWPLELAILAGVATGAACGLLTGVLVTWAGIVPFIVTLGAYAYLRGLARAIAGDNLVRLDDAETQLGWLSGFMQQVEPGRRWMLLPGEVWLMLLLALLAAFMLRYTRFGRHLFAVGSNELTARLCGVHVHRVKIAVYTLSGALAGVVGVLLLGRLTEGDPTAGQGMELQAIAAVVIGGASLAGGQGSIAGALIGVLLLTVISNGASVLGWPDWIELIVTGAIITLAAAIDVWRHRGTR